MLVVSFKLISKKEDTKEKKGQYKTVTSNLWSIMLVELLKLIQKEEDTKEKEWSI